MTRTIPAHWIKANEGARIPRCHIVLDAEAVITEGDHGEEHLMRVAVTSCDSKGKNGHTWQATKWAEHEQPVDVWAWISARSLASGRTVVVAHNAGYDLRITDGMNQLEALGWQLTMLSLNFGATWATWRRRTATLVLVDSMTWFPMALQRIGELIGRPKPDLPTQTDDAQLWRARCRADVEILRDAWMRCIGWLADSNAGNWRPTGAGMAWSFWRHQHYTHRILSHSDDDLRTLERQAAWTGRAEAWQLGRMKTGPWVEWDMTAAHARIARDCNVPTKPWGELPDPTKWERASRRDTRAVLLDCIVSTDVPVAPTSHADGILWPVGTFPTTLWDHEARMVLDAGGTITPRRAFVYSTAPALRSWAEWVLDVIGQPIGSVDPVVQAMVKHWSRALIGKFATRYATWEHFGDLPTRDFRSGWAFDADAQEMQRTLHVGNRLLMQSAMVDGHDTAPAVMSWIMAECRRRLWHVMQSAGIDHVAYVDTDAVIVDTKGDRALAAADLDGLRRKGRWQRLEIIGTRRLVLDGQLRAAGVQRGAVKASAQLWEVEAWAGLTGSLARGVTDRVTVSKRTVRLDGIERRRVRKPGGTTLPVVLPVPSGRKASARR